MSRALLFDTCVVQHYLHPKVLDRWPHLAERIARAVRDAGGFHISEVIAFEIRRGLAVLARKGQGRKKAARAELLLRKAYTHPLNAMSWHRAIDIYADGQEHRPVVNLSDGDLLITATAVASSRILLTMDRRLHEALCALGASRAHRADGPELSSMQPRADCRARQRGRGARGS